MNAEPAQQLPAVTLVLGGMRSGKSAYAEALVEAAGPGLYLATAEAGDGEMAERIRLHRERRGPNWTTVEEPLELAAALAEHADAARPVLVDCLTLWLSNLMGEEKDLDLETQALTERLGTLNGPVVLVSNEVGGGIIPDNALARQFADAAGRLNQAVAAVADRVVLVSAGLPQVLKDKTK